MKPIIHIINLSFIMAIMTTGCTEQQEKTNAPTPPVANKINKELTIHQHTRTDQYYWLNERENPEVIKYLEAENAYTKAMMKHTEPLQDKLYKEIIGRIKQTDMSVPYKDNGYYYYTRYEEGKEYPIHCRKSGSLDGEEAIMLDVNKMAVGHEYYNVTSLQVSPDNRILAYGVDTFSRRIYTIYFMDLTTGKTIGEAIPGTTGSAAWANDNKTVFYTLKDDALRSYMIMKHKLGTDPSTDRKIFHEADETFGTYVYRTKSDQFLMIGSYNTLSTEFQYLDANDPDGTFTVFQPREKEHEYSVYHYNSEFYITTNLEAKNFRLMKCPLGNTGKANWTEVIPHRDNVRLEDIEIFEKYLVLDEKKDGLNHLRIMDMKDKTEHYIDFGEEAYTAYISINPDFKSGLLRYGYSSMTTPYSTYDYNMKTREKTLLKQQEVVGDFDPANYHSERLWATARDGIKVPVSLVYRKGVKKDGSNPLLLYGYGSYGSSEDADFSSTRLSLLDRGFIFAIAHIRGGEDLGRQWYEDGKLLKKKNTFTDFIDCAEFLVNENYTAPDQLFAIGGSAGGLLMGAIVNMRPDLWKGVIAAVPFVDVITTMLDEDIPLTTGEYDEWGNPNIKEYYDYILTYSPYDNVAALDYPALLVTTGLHDSQVQYWEPAKWVARMRTMKTGNNPLLLYTNMGTGHSGASGRFERHKETAMEYAFLLDQLSINE